MRLSQGFGRASLLALALGLAAPVAAKAGEACGRLSTTTLRRTVVEVTEDAGACRVRGVARPRRDSRIGFELWLPSSGWNGRLLMLGNGGYSSALPLAAMGDYLRAGYAVTATDTGHAGDDPDFAIDRPAAIDDWARHAVHETVTRAKALTTAYYNHPPRFAYFQGCSTGGHQAFMEVQRYPEDFDGVVAGAPGNNRTRLNADFLWRFKVNHTTDAQPRLILPAAKLPLLTRAALAQCGRANGAEAGGTTSDPYLNAPQRCAFDPGVLRCAAEDRPDCLTVPQITAARALYDGPRNPRTGQRIAFGLPPGSETSAGLFGGWSAYWADPARPSEPARANFWRHWAGFGPAWDWRTFDFDRDLTRADARLARRINAMNPDLELFRRRGGKLIHWHGAADPVVPVQNSIAYHQRVVASQRSQGREADAFYRLFLAPGVEHCQGGAGPAPVGLQAAIEDWVERRRAPDQLLASRTSGAEVVSRPLCPYPRIARYDGQGRPDLAASFSCVAPAKLDRIETPAAGYPR